MANAKPVDVVAAAASVEAETVPALDCKTTPIVDVSAVALRLTRANLIWYGEMAALMTRGYQILGETLTTDNILRPDLNNGFIEGTRLALSENLKRAPDILDRTLKELSG